MAANPCNAPCNPIEAKRQNLINGFKDFLDCLQVSSCNLGPPPCLPLCPPSPCVPCVPQIVCLPCPGRGDPGRNGGKNMSDEDKPLPPWHKDRYKSRELKGGILLTGCDCTKRNGLQHDCRRTDCQGRPPCLLKPDPDCLPSGGTGLKGAEPRVSKYSYKQPECPPKQERERGPPRPDPCHRAAVDCDRCKPAVLMCRPGECTPKGGYETCPEKRQDRSNMRDNVPQKQSLESQMFECKQMRGGQNEEMYECRPMKRKLDCPTNQMPRVDDCPSKYDRSNQERGCKPAEPQPVQRILALECRDKRTPQEQNCPDPRCPSDPRCPPNPCCPPYCEPPTHILKNPAYEKKPPPPVSQGVPSSAVSQGQDQGSYNSVCFPLSTTEESETTPKPRYRKPPRSTVDDWKLAYPCPKKCDPECVVVYGEACKWHKKIKPLKRFTHAELMSQW